MNDLLVTALTLLVVIAIAALMYVALWHIAGFLLGALSFEQLAITLLLSIGIGTARNAGN